MRDVVVWVERHSFFPFPMPPGVSVTGVSDFSFRTTPGGDVSSSRESELSHQQKAKAQHTNCQ
jgi:hypothetical protein